jgi:hypothetical protein
LSRRPFEALVSGSRRAQARATHRIDAPTRFIVAEAGAWNQAARSNIFFDEGRDVDNLADIAY